MRWSNEKERGSIFEGIWVLRKGMSTVGLGLTHYKALKNKNLILRVVFIS